MVHSKIHQNGLFTKYTSYVDAYISCFQRATINTVDAYNSSSAVPGNVIAVRVLQAEINNRCYGIVYQAYEIACSFVEAGY